MATTKPLEIIVSEDLYALPEIQRLVEQGHTVRYLGNRGFDLILGDKANNLTVDDIKENPKLLTMLVQKAQGITHPGKVKK